MSPQSITIHYTLKNKAGETLDTSYDGEPLTYVEGTSQIIPGLEESLRGCKTGEKKHIVVPAEDGYGDRDERLVMQVPLKEFPQGKAEVGQEYDIEIGDTEVSHLFRVTSISNTHATLDGNHPMAGLDLYFDVEVKEAREATQDEIEAAEAEDDEDVHEHHEGCSHGPGGHLH